MKKETNYPSIDKSHLEGVTFGEKHPIIPNFLSISNALNVLALKNDKYCVDCLDLRVKGSELKKDALILAKTLIQLGVKPGDTIACAMPNYYQGLLVFMASNTIGATTTYLNAFSSKEEIKDYLNMVNAKVFVNSNPSREINEYYRKNSGVEYTISLDEKNVNSRDFYSEKTATIGNTNIINFHEIGHIADFQKNRFRTWFGGSQDALILQTSGSTGKPKSMLFTNENVLAALIYLGNSTHTPGPTAEDSRWMNVVPFMYPYGFVASVLGPLFVNRELILTPNVNASQISEYYKKNPHVIFGSPAFLDLTMKNLPKEQDCSSLKIYVSGGDFLSKQKSLDAVDFFKEHNATVAMANGSGNGEILGCCTNSMNVEYRPETVGQLVVGPKYLIVNPDTMEEVKYGEPGVLLVSGKHMFQHYIHNEEETNKVKININGTTYYNTGNYGILHKDRYFELIGRASRFYIISTLNKVYCELVQKIISFNKMVDTCVVVPKPNDQLLFEGKAYIKLKPGYEENEETMKQILEACYLSYVDPITQEELKLKEYEIPASITFVEEIKRHDDSEKIDYEFYRKEAEKEYQLEKSSTKDDVIQKKLS